MTDQVAYKKAAEGDDAQDGHTLGCEQAFSRAQTAAARTAVEIPPGTREGEQQEQEAENSRVQQGFEDAAVNVREIRMVHVGHDDEPATGECTPSKEWPLKNKLPGDRPPLGTASQSCHFALMLATKQIVVNDRAKTTQQNSNCADRGHHRASNET